MTNRCAIITPYFFLSLLYFSTPPNHKFWRLLSPTRHLISPSRGCLYTLSKHTPKKLLLPRFNADGQLYLLFIEVATVPPDGFIINTRFIGAQFFLLVSVHASPPNTHQTSGIYCTRMFSAPESCTRRIGNMEESAPYCSFIWPQIVVIPCNLWSLVGCCKEINRVLGYDQMAFPSTVIVVIAAVISAFFIHNVTSEQQGNLLIFPLALRCASCFLAPTLFFYNVFCLFFMPSMIFFYRWFDSVIRRLMYCWLDWSIDWLIDWLVVRLIGRLIDWSIDWLIVWLFVCLFDWLIDWLIRYSVIVVAIFHLYNFK